MFRLETQTGEKFAVLQKSHGKKGAVFSLQSQVVRGV